MDKYKIIRELGRGRIGMVYEAEDVDNHLRVALKIIPVHSDTNPNIENDLAERISGDVHVFSQVKHTNLIHFYDCSIHNEKAFISMEMCHGITLKDFLKIEKTLPQPNVKEIALNILSALDTVHKAGIVHSNIGPQNIMLARDGSIKLMDFCVAKIESDIGVRILGTSGYMPPEQAVDQRSDLFSLGAVLYECLTGEKAFSAASTAVPVPWNGILEKAMAKDPNQRYRSAAEMIGDIQSGKDPLAVQSTLTLQQPVQQLNNLSSSYPPAQQPSDPAPDPTLDKPRDDIPIWYYLITGRYYYRQWGDNPSPQMGMSISTLSVVSTILGVILILLGFPGGIHNSHYTGHSMSFGYPIVEASGSIVCMVVGVILLIIAGFSIRRDLRR